MITNNPEVWGGGGGKVTLFGKKKRSISGKFLEVFAEQSKRHANSRTTTSTHYLQQQKFCSQCKH